MIRREEELIQGKTSNLLVVFISTCTFIIPFIKKTTLVELIPLTLFIDEIFILLLIRYIINGFRILFRYKWGRQVLLCFFIYNIFGILSGIFNNVSLQQVSYQVILDIKFLLILLIFISAIEIQDLVDKFIKISKIISILSIILILWQYLSPYTYKLLFINEPKFTYLKLPFSLGEINRAVGIFWHPGQLAFFGSLLSMYFIFSFHFTKNKKVVPWILISGCLLFASCSRVEIAATSLSLFLILNISSEKYGKIFQFLIVFFTLVVIWPLINGFLQIGIDSYGIQNIKDSAAARIVFYYNSVLIAKDYFPMGSGFGTFGGQAAVVFDSDIYSQLGFYQYYWYRNRIFLTDTFWPHVLGETGIIGTSAYLMMLIIIAARLLTQFNFFLKSRVDADNLVTVALACGAYCVLIINSLASSNLSTSPSLIYGFFLISVTILKLSHQNNKYLT